MDSQAIAPDSTYTATTSYTKSEATKKTKQNKTPSLRVISCTPLCQLVCPVPHPEAAAAGSRHRASRPYQPFALALPKARSEEGVS